jgi:predicted Zn-dependent peptidase
VQPINGTPLEVPVPKSVICAETSFHEPNAPRFKFVFNGDVDFTFIDRYPFYIVLERCRNLGILCVLSLASTSCFESTLEDHLKIDLKIQQSQLKNGLRVLLIQDFDLPSVSYQTWIQAGSVNDPPGKSGLAHFFEHLYFKGSSDLEKEGAELSASTGRDSTVFYSTFAPHLLDQMIELDAKRLKELSFDEKDLHIQKAIALEERRVRIEENMEAKASEFLWMLLYRTHPYGNPILGHPHELTQIEMKDLEQFKENYYQPNAILIVIAGPIDFESTLKTIKKHFDTIPGKPVPKLTIPDEPKPTEQRRLRLKLPGSIGHRLWMGIPTPSGTDLDAYSIDVLNNILFEGQSSRLYQNEVIKNKTFTSIQGQSYTPQFHGLMTIAAHLRPGVTLESAEQIIEKNIELLAKTPPTQAEVDKAIHQLTLDIIAGAQSSQGTAQLAGMLTTLLGNPKKIFSVLKKYHSVTPTDVQKIAQKISDRNLRAIVEIRATPPGGDAE